MYQKKFTITSQNGLHIRPLSTFVKQAKTYSSNINLITSDGKSANAKSMFQLQTLDLVKGKIITVSASGVDEQVAVEGLIQLLAQLE